MVRTTGLKQKSDDMGRCLISVQESNVGITEYLWFSSGNPVVDPKSDKHLDPCTSFVIEGLT